jgi:arylsulfatase A-like enzyme
MSPRPNILLLMCDDLGYGDTGFNGNEIIQTPCLDALCAEGGRFTRFYAGGPVCSPTRATCLTGRHYSRYGITHANVGCLPEQEITIARIARLSGYTTGHFGKWHLGTLDRNYSGQANRHPAREYAPPWERDYDVSFATEYAVPTWDPSRGYDRQTLERTGPTWGSPYYLNGRKVEEPLPGCDSKHIVDRAESFVRAAAGRGQAFFASVWFHAPHAPIFAGPEFLDLYRQHPVHAAHYYGVVTAMDRQVGRLNRLLKDLGLEDNTMLWFCSDNGPEGNGLPQLATDPLFRRFYGSTGGLRGRKRSLFNGGVGVPALVKWPGVVRPGVEFAMPCSTLDYFPTIADLLAYAMPDRRPMDGISLLPMLSGRMTARPAPIPYRFLDRRRQMFDSPTFALTDNQHKFLTNLSSHGDEDLLFDLETDVAETTNILAGHRDRGRVMRRCLEEFAASCRRSHHGGDYSSPYEPVNAFQEMTGTWKE